MLKFKSTVFIGKVFFFIVFPFIFLFASVVCAMKIMIGSFLFGAFCIFMAYLCPVLFEELLFRYYDKVEREFKENKIHVQ